MTDAARKLRISVLETAYRGGDANLQSVFSSIEILRVLYDRVLRITPGTKDSPNRDYFVLSKGQSTMGLLALLAEKGYFGEEELETACQYDSRISMQADRTKLPGVEICAGSLGHGFPIAAGIAYAGKIQGRNGQVYVLAGDGEMNEGTMWEAALFAVGEKLDNLTLIVDDNASLKEMLDIGDIGSKLENFGFDIRYVDGHDEEGLFQVIARPHIGRPGAVIARTKRGYGSHILMEDRSWFHRAPDQEELAQLTEDVKKFGMGG
ncbi:MAG: hypothetical protein K2N63_15925 [Lachnospiraceae bacterium]|nr:hypothetical protein [Lachnospiraceae bacterium]